MATRRARPDGRHRYFCQTPLVMRLVLRWSTRADAKTLTRSRSRPACRTPRHHKTFPQPCALGQPRRNAPPGVSTSRPECWLRRGPSWLAAAVASRAVASRERHRPQLRQHRPPRTPRPQTQRPQTQRPQTPNSPQIQPSPRSGSARPPWSSPRSARRRPGARPAIARAPTRRRCATTPATTSRPTAYGVAR